MDLFVQIALSFPTLIFSVLLLVALTYWMLAMLGLVEIDISAFSAVPDGADVEVGELPGVLAKFGLDGVPVTLIFTAIVFFGWLFSYFGDLFLLSVMEPGLLRHLLAAAVAVAALLLAIPFAGLALRPLHGLFKRGAAPSSECLLGRSAIVRSPEVTASRGTASLDDGGAGLILQVRAEPGLFRRGDSVVLVEYIAADNAYRVIAESAVVSPTAPSGTA